MPQKVLLLGYLSYSSSNEKFNKVKRQELSSLLQSAVKLKSVGSHGTLILPYNQFGCVGMERLEEVVLAFPPTVLVLFLPPRFW